MSRLADIIEVYRRYGYPGLFLRPVNYQGFARSLLTPTADDGPALWAKGVEILQAALQEGHPPLREFGLETALRRIFSPNHTAHVDLRSPNPAARDTLLVDYDGTFYPSDEARMLARQGVADLSLGNLRKGLDGERVNALTWSQMADVHEDCLHCVHLPWCGIDGVDDVSWHGRSDLPKRGSHFCRYHRAVFDFIFSTLLGGDPNRLSFLAFHLTGVPETLPFFGPFRYDAA